MKSIDEQTGVVTIFINVGTMQSYKAEAFCEHLIQKLRSKRADVLPNFRFIVMPQRTGDNRVEITADDGTLATYSNVLSSRVNALIESALEKHED